VGVNGEWRHASISTTGGHSIPSGSRLPKYILLKCEFVHYQNVYLYFSKM